MNESCHIIIKITFLWGKNNVCRHGYPVSIINKEVQPAEVLLQQNDLSRRRSFFCHKKPVSHSVKQM
ncbi:hypothetical protein BN1183_AQ_00490 [Pantoea ananatis]|nr:hypothetical protein BN1183_AQ_00490 [Pantoea ananatis]